MAADAALRPAVFFDRDGVLNVDEGYTHRPDQLVFTPGAEAAVRAVNAAGAFAFVVTNQAGVARGLYGEADVAAFHDHMQAELGRAGARIDAFAFCPHHPGHGERIDCRRRKPNPGMILDLMAEHPVDRARSVMIGDRQSDMDAAAAAGIVGLRYAGGDLGLVVAQALAAIGLEAAA